MTLLFALLSLIALAGSLGLIVMLVIPSLRPTALREFGPYAIPTAATVATVATLGSLYMSEIENFLPCRLCWVQRGFMYPLAAFLIAASIKRWAWTGTVGLVVSAIGGGVAVFHYAEQRGWVGGEGFCDIAVPCSQIWIDHFGFMSIPFMAFTGFLFVATLMITEILARRASTI